LKEQNKVTSAHLFTRNGEKCQKKIAGGRLTDAASSWRPGENSLGKRLRSVLSAYQAGLDS